MTKCQHLIVKFWEAEEKVLGDHTIFNPGITIGVGGWKCVECGMKFLPRDTVDDMIRQIMRGNQ